MTRREMAMVKVACERAKIEYTELTQEEKESVLAELRVSREDIIDMCIDWLDDEPGCKQSDYLGLCIIQGLDDEEIQREAEAIIEARYR